MKQLIILLLMPLAVWTQAPVDLLIKNGKIMTGNGNSWFYGDVAISNGKILKVGKLGNIAATQTIDAKRMIVAPGFIDVHTHIENDEVKNPQAANFIYDGVTTVITGNCGSSSSDLGVYFTKLDSLQLSVNTASLIGHNTVRRAVLGTANRPASPAELEQMKALVHKAMQAGAVGLSTGLIYIPGTYAPTSEVVELAKTAAQWGGVYASHIRNEDDSVVQAIEEAIAIGRQANIPVQISHFKVGGQQNWGRSPQTIALVEQARLQGIDVTIDQYPYTASSTNLNTLLPDWILSDGSDSINARIQRPEIRQQAVAHMLARLQRRKLKHFSFAVVANYRADTSFNGLSIEGVNLKLGRKNTPVQEAETVLEMVRNGGAQMVFHGMSEDDVATIMRYPYNMFASDASIRVFGEGVPHPRGYGTNARVLAEYVRNKKVITLEEAIRRMTSLPAQKFNLSDRGLLAPGFAADIVIFDPEKVVDQSTFSQPHQYSKGFEYVLVNGNITVSNGKHTGARAGSVLRHYRQQPD